MKKAVKTDWKTKPVPKNYLLLPSSSNITFNQDEYDKIKIGFIPASMEDKWFLYFDNNILFCHRSWNGIIVYEIFFSKSGDCYNIDKIKFNPSIYEKNYKIDSNYELQMVLFLINRILLNKNVELPIDPNIKIENNMQYWMYRHGQVGNATSNDEREIK